MTRSTSIVVVALTTIFTLTGYLSYQNLYGRPSDVQPLTGPGLHRSNAVRRRRRSSRNTRNEEEHGIDDHVSEPDANPETLRILHDSETVVDEAPDNWWDGSSPPSQPRNGFNIVGLLFRVSEDNARRNACVHRGCACNACGTVPIRGIRYRCANCADFDLCETCEAQNLHNKTHIFYKIKVPAPSFGPRSMQPVWYPGDPDQAMRNIPKALIPRLTEETGFERPELDAFWEQWTFMANTEWRDDPDGLYLAMNRATFERCLAPSGGYKHASPNLIHDRMFAFYDSNHDNLIGFSEFLRGLSYRKRKDKLKKIFEGYDIDGDGFINRRDCLRMFRAYYVLYKQMHRDILEGIDNQVMSSTEAQQLVNGRQPLSSLFGRDTRVPPGDFSRPVEGKVMNINGDVHITDGNENAVTQDGHDTATREEVLSGLFSRERPRVQTVRYELRARSRRDPNPNYWESMINTPHEISELPQLLVGEPRSMESRELQDIFNQVTGVIHNEESDSEGSRSSNEENRQASADGGSNDHGHDEHSNTQQNEINEPSSSNSHANSPSVNPDREPSGSASLNGNYRNRNNELHSTETSHDEDTERDSCDEHHLELDTRDRLLLAERNRRAVARRQLHERWKRRQFYLDEEEGGRAPEDWDSDEDILEQTNGANEEHGTSESSKSAQRPVLSPRSRSSSKVRFAEDTDEYEVRSNPSTSSRSVPERWGGFDIPEAERDAGKEILYQVKQQAFNELLDVIFKMKEDLAVRWAETKTEREIWRPLFSTIDLDAEVSKVEDMSSGGEAPKESRRNRQTRHFDVPERASHAHHQQEDPFTDSSRPDGEHSLEELLSISGYTISIPDEEASHDGNATTPRNDANASNSNGQEHASDARPLSTEGHERCDPTMPQFRPNTASDARPQAHFADRAVIVSPDATQPEAWITIPTEVDHHSGDRSVEVESPIIPTDPQESGSDDSESKAKLQHNGKSTGKRRTKDKGKKPAKWYDMPTQPDKALLMEYKVLEEAEKEAKERGGWGKLSYEEFERIYKRQEMNGNRLDYLGSWIDFCIP